MSFLDLLGELGTEEAGPDKAAEALRFLVWVSIFGGMWNVIIGHMFPYVEVKLGLSSKYPEVAMAAGLILATALYLSSKGLKKGAPWGRKVARLAIILFVVSVVWTMFLTFYSMVVPLGYSLEGLAIGVLLTIAGVQLLLIAVLSFRCLGRPSPRGERKYEDALFPGGIYWTAMVMIALPSFVAYLVWVFLGPENGESGILLTIFAMLVGSVAFNFFPSPFEQSREVVCSSTGGGSIFLFRVPWPFFRLLVFQDGLEVRVLFHRYFVPYEKMEGEPKKVGIFVRGFLIESNVPGVPSRLRFYGFRIDDLLKMISHARDLHVKSIRT